MTTWLDNNKGTPVYRMFQSSEYAPCYVMANMGAVWEQGWKYSKDNENTSASEMKSFKKYQGMSEDQAIEDGVLEEWKKYKVEKRLFSSGTSPKLCKENISKEGKAYYYRMYILFEHFLNLPSTDERVEEFNAVWDELDMEFGLISTMANRRRGKRKLEEFLDEDSEPSNEGLNVVLPNEIGHMEYLQEKLVEMGGEDVWVCGV